VRPDTSLPTAHTPKSQQLQPSPIHWIGRDQLYLESMCVSLQQQQLWQQQPADEATPAVLWMSPHQQNQRTRGSRGTRRSAWWVPGQLSLGNNIIWFRSITFVHILKFCGNTQHTYSTTKSTLVNPNARRWHQVSIGLLLGKDHFKWDKVPSRPSSTEVQWNRCESWDGLVKPTSWSYKLCW
jgi:hypothetical protein